MIKVNLAKGVAVGGLAGSDSASVDNERSRQQRIALRNLVLLLLGPIVLIVLEDQNITEKRIALNKARSTLSVLQEKNEKAKSALEETRRFREEQKKLEVQIQSIEGIRKNRKKEAMLLDYLRRSIPNRVWLDFLDVNDSKVQIRGFAIADSDLTQFMDSLSRSAFLKEVSLQRSQEQNSPEFGAIKQFELACLMELQ